MGVNYWETYSPVVNWMSVRAMLTLIILRDIHTKSVDFVLDYTQSGVKSEIFMELPIGFGIEGAHPREWVIRLDKNLFGLKYAGLSWFEKLKEGLEARYFVQSQVDLCLWYKEEIVLLSYVDDCLIFSPSKDEIDEVEAT